jgi:hypothetical protein
MVVSNGGSCLICTKPLGTGPEQCSPEERCWVKEGRSPYSVDLQMAELAGKMKADNAHRSQLAPLMAAVLNFECLPPEAPPDVQALHRDLVVRAACELFKDDPEAEALRAWVKARRAPS